MKISLIGDDDEVSSATLPSPPKPPQRTPSKPQKQRTKTSSPSSDPASLADTVLAILEAVLPKT